MFGRYLVFYFAVILAAFAGLADPQRKEAGAAQATPTPYEYEMPDYQQLTKTDWPVLAISRDGKQFAYCTTLGIYVCTVNPYRARLIAGTRGDTVLPVFSPDGSCIAYWSSKDQMLMRVSTAGGDPAPLRDVRGPISGLQWFTNDSIVFSRYSGNIFRVSADGKKPKSILNTDFGTMFPQLLPDGETMLYSISSSGNVKEAKTVVQPLQSGKEKVLFDGYGASYLSSGHVVYRSPENVILASPFDQSKLEITGQPTAILKSVWTTGVARQYAISQSGTLVYIPDDSATITPGKLNLVWVTRDGKEEPVGTPPNTYTDARISPDGNRLALTVKTGSSTSIWIWDFIHRKMFQLTSGVNAANPLWASDSRRILYHSSRDDSSIDIVSETVDSPGRGEKLASIPQKSYSCFWSENEKELVLLPLQGADSEYPPQISPDGKWIAYRSNESGRYEVYVRPFPEVSKGKWLVSSGGGTNPLWLPNGHGIIYRYGESILEVPVETSPVFKVGNPKPLFWRPDTQSVGGQATPTIWDISPDGRRFLMANAVQPMHRICLIDNWHSLVQDQQPR